MKGAQAYDAMMQRILFEPCGRRVRWRARDRVHSHMSLYGLCDPSASPSHKKSLAGKQQQSWFVGTSVRMMKRHIIEIIGYMMCRSTVKQKIMLRWADSCSIDLNLSNVSRRVTRWRWDTRMLLLEGFALRENMTFDVAPLTAAEKRFARCFGIGVFEKDPKIMRGGPVDARFGKQDSELLPEVMQWWGRFRRRRKRSIWILEEIIAIKESFNLLFPIRIIVGKKFGDIGESDASKGFGWLMGVGNEGVVVGHGRQGWGTTSLIEEIGNEWIV
ncbi:hypothetical protein D0Y65_039159 [Glycine soja]|uniref:Uncharacterized protein n=1 Tax=Glycine soja TaxID=3848 RepID=A0A445H7U4_GLYSO|nr:hypothetical protein D0Y65_039159 [Glycine soja]